MSSVICPKCKYHDAEKTITYKAESLWRGTMSKTTTWFCPKCNFRKENSEIIDQGAYNKEIGRRIIIHQKDWE